MRRLDPAEERAVVTIGEKRLVWRRDGEGATCISVSSFRAGWKEGAQKASPVRVGDAGSVDVRQ